MKSVAFRLPSRFRLTVQRSRCRLFRFRHSGPVPVVVLMLLCQRNAGAGWRRDSQGPVLVLADLHHRHIHDDFRLCLVEIVHKFLRQRDLIGSSSYDDGALRLQLLDALTLPAACAWRSPRPAVRWPAINSKDKKS